MMDHLEGSICHMLRLTIYKSHIAVILSFMAIIINGLLRIIRAYEDAISSMMKNEHDNDR